MGRRGERHFDAGVSVRSPRRRSCSSISCCSRSPSCCWCSCAGSIRRNFGLALNAIRDDEEKAEAMGLHTRRYKRTRLGDLGFFLGIAGAIFGNMTGFIEPRDIAFPTTTFKHLHGGDGAARRQGHAVGAGHRRGDFPYHQGGDLDLLSRLAVHRARAPDRRHRRLLPAGHRRLADGEISQAVRSRGRAQDASPSRRSRRGSRRTRGAPNERRHHRTRKRDEIVRRRRRQPRRVAHGGARRYHRADRAERLRQDHAVQFHRRLSPDRFGLDPLRRPRDLAAQGAGDRAARHAAHVPADAHLRQDGLRAEHADLDSAPQGGLRDMFAREDGAVAEKAEHLLAFVGLYEKRNLRRAVFRSASRSCWNSPWR